MNNTLLQTYALFPLTLVKGKGSFVWDDQGKKYLDFYGGHAVCLIGHSPNSVIAAITSQAQELMFYSNIVHTLPSQALARKLSSTLKEPSQVYLANSGNEANETALKIARKYTGKNHIISFHKDFHGRGAAALAVTGMATNQYNRSRH